MKQPSDFIHRHPIDPAQREHLRQWLAEWNVQPEIDAIAAAFATDLESLAGLEQVAESHDAADRLHAGSVLLLDPALTPNIAEPVYLALLKEWDAFSWLCAPFSLFGAPCLPAELLTERDSGPLRVLQLWNARTIPDAVLEQSWFVDTLSRTEQADALEIFSAQYSGNYPARLLGRTGPPIVVEHDPRIDYQRQAIAGLATLHELAMRTLASAPKILAFSAADSLIHNQCWQLPMAAADPTPNSKLAWVTRTQLANPNRAIRNQPPVEDCVATLCDSPQQLNDDSTLGIVSWTLEPAVTGASRALIVDDAGTTICEATVPTSGGMVLSDPINWDTLQPYAEDLSKLRALTIVLVLS
jgi:hypothetical protein